MFKIIKIKGISMMPLYFEGEYCLCKTVKNKKKLRIGDIVVVETVFGKLIKQISFIDYKKECVNLKGLNSNSISSEKLGAILFEDVLYKVIFPVRKLK